jgi:hypothetical protein
VHAPAAAVAYNANGYLGIVVHLEVKGILVVLCLQHARPTDVIGTGNRAGRDLKLFVKPAHKLA